MSRNKGVALCQLFAFGFCLGKTYPRIKLKSLSVYETLLPQISVTKSRSLIETKNVAKPRSHKVSQNLDRFLFYFLSFIIFGLRVLVRTRFVIMCKSTFFACGRHVSSKGECYGM